MFSVQDCMNFECNEYNYNSVRLYESGRNNIQECPLLQFSFTIFSQNPS